MSLLRLGHLRQDGTSRVTPLANASRGWEGGTRGRLTANRPPRFSHNYTGGHGAVLAQVDALRLEGCVRT